MHKIQVYLCMLIMLCIMAQADTVHAVMFRTTELGTLGGNYSRCVGINEKGQVIGMSTTSNGYNHAFEWEDGVMVDLGTLGGDFRADYGTDATVINNKGQIIGSSYIEVTGSTSIFANEHAYIWEDGVMTDLGTLGGDTCHACDINDAGQIVGYSTKSQGDYHAFIWENGAMSEIEAAGGYTNYEAVAINNKGQVVGNGEDSNHKRYFFVYDNGKLTYHGIPDGDCWAVDINDDGEVIGYNVFGAFTMEAFIWTEKTGMTDLSSFGAYGYPKDVNEAGDVIGFGYNEHGIDSFLWEDGVTTALDAPGGNQTLAEDINENDQVVGTILPYTDYSNAYFWKDGIMSQLPVPDGTVSEARALNDSGQIVGATEYNPCYVRATLWEIIPDLEISIDIKPKDDTNTVSLGSKSSIPVAIFSSDTFDAGTINPETVSLSGCGVKRTGRGSKYQWRMEDVNGDGLTDVICRINFGSHLSVEPGNFMCNLTAECYDGTLVQGSDFIHVVPKGTKR